MALVVDALDPAGRLARAHPQAGLLGQLHHHASAGVSPRLDPAAGDRPQPGRRLVTAAHEQRAASSTATVPTQTVGPFTASCAR